MAQVIVRPISDVSTTGIGFSSGTLVYPLINEVLADGDTTCVNLASLNAMFTVRCSVPDTSKIKTINSITIFATTRDSGYANEDIRFGFNSPMSMQGAFVSDGTSTYVQRSVQFSINQTPSNFNLSAFDIYCTLQTLTNVKTIIYVTQMYVVIDYVPASDVNVKVDNAWHDNSTMYEKVNDIWKPSDIKTKAVDSWH